MNNIPTWIAFLVSALLGAFVALIVQVFVVPWQRRKVLEQVKASTKPVTFTFEGSTGEYLMKAFIILFLIVSKY